LLTIFLDKIVESKFRELRQKAITPQTKRFLLSACLVMVPFCFISILNIANSVKQGVRDYLNHELTQFLDIMIALILELIVFCIDKLYFLRGGILTLAIFIYMQDLSTQKQIHPSYMSTIGFPMIMQIFTIAFLYTRAWISSSIFVNIGLIYYVTMTIIRVPFSVMTWLSTIACSIATSILSIISFYQLDIQHRKDFFYLINSKKKKQSLKTLFKEMPCPLLVKYPSYCFINEPFKSLFFGAELTNRTNTLLMKEEKENQIRKKLNEIKEKISGRGILEYMGLDNMTQEINKYIFQYYDEESQGYIDLQIKGIKLTIENSETSIFIFTNLSEIDMLEKKIEKKYQKMLIASFSHDIRTPINGCMGFITKLESFQQNDKAKKLIKKINSSCLKLLYFIDLLQDYTYIESDNFTPLINHFNPSDIVKEVLNIFSWEIHAKKLNLIFEDLKCTSCNLINDLRRIREILFVFITNAVKYTMKGEIKITIVHDHQNEEYIFSVIDTGIGIEPERIESLFNLFGQKNKHFTSLNPQGVGIGLYVSNQLAEKLKGKISCISRLQEGSNFSLKIKSFEEEKSIVDELIESSPRHNLQESISVFPTIQNATTCDCPKYLVVDDDLMNRKVLKFFIESVKSKCDQAVNGEEAILKVSERSSNNCCKKYILIFMDINMPIMDGIQATQKLRFLMNNNQIPSTYIVALTAAHCSSEEDIKQFLSVGFDGFYQKPLSKQVFISIIEKYK